MTNHKSPLEVALPPQPEDHTDSKRAQISASDSAATTSDSSQGSQGSETQVSSEGSQSSGFSQASQSLQSAQSSQTSQISQISQTSLNMLCAQKSQDLDRLDSSEISHNLQVESSTIQSSETKKTTTRWSIFAIRVLLFVGTLALIGYQIGTPSLFETSEGRFASIGRAMIDTGDWLIPRFNGLVHLAKPPMAYWATAIGQMIFGFNETGARALLPLAAALTVLGCFQIGLLMLSVRGALIATFVLLTSLFFNTQFRGLTADPFLAMFETWMVWSLIKFVQTQKLSIGLLFYTMAGAAMLTKGPPGLLPLLGLLPGLYKCYGRDRLKRLAAITEGWLVFVVLGLGWYLLMGIRFPGAISYFIFDETIARVASTAHERSGPIYYYIGILLTGSLPWTLFFLAGLISLISSIKDNKQPMNLLLLLWLAIPFLVFSLSRSKLPAYALPLMVPVALICGRYLAPMLHLDEDEPLSYKLESSVTLFIFATVAVATLYCAWGGIIPDQRLAKVVLFLAFHLILLTGFGYLFLSWEMAKGILLVLGFIVPGSMIFLMPGLRGDEEIAPRRYLPGYRALLENVAALPAKANIICIEDMLHSAFFYTGRVIPTWNVTRETRFDPELAKLYDLHGDEVLRKATAEGAFLLIRSKDVPKVEPIVGRRLEIIAKTGIWGLYRTGPVLATWRPIGDAMPSAFQQIENNSNEAISASFTSISNRPHFESVDASGSVIPVLLASSSYSFNLSKQASESQNIEFSVGIAASQGIASSSTVASSSGVMTSVTATATQIR